MSDSTPPDDQHQQSPWSRPAVLLSGAFLLALIGAAILVAVAGGGGSRQSTACSCSPASSRYACS